MIYLDHNATTPVHPAVVEAMLPFLRAHWGNPSSSHAAGRAARRGVQRARAQVAALIGTDPEHIVFTSGGTESDNLAVRGVHAARGGRIVTSPFEHPAVAQPVAYLERHGTPVTRLRADEDGRVEVPSALPDDTTLLSVILAHNETGVVQPLGELALRARAVEATVHTDAAQAIGKIAVNVDELEVDLLTIAGHKVYAPKGVGALYVRPGTPIEPLVRGANHEHGLRPGTENVPSIVGLGVACQLAADHLAFEQQRMERLREQLWAGLSAGVPGLRRTGRGCATLPNTLHVRFPGVLGEALLARCPHLAASTGSACHSGEHHPSASLLAMGLAPDDALGAVRLSLGSATSEADVRGATEQLLAAWEALGAAG